MTTYATRQSEQMLRRDIVRFGRIMHERGLLCGFEGNLSARIDDERLLVTPSGFHKGLLNEDQLLVVDMEGRPIRWQSAAAARLRPTSELPMHLEAYAQRPDMRAVVHAHPPITVALSIAGVRMDTCLLPEVIVLMGYIPMAAYAMSSSVEGALAIRELIQHHDAIILQRHGTLTVGKTLEEAFMRLETVEQNARIHHMLAQLGVNSPLEPYEVRKLLQMRRSMGLERAGDAERFRALWGVGPE